MITMVSYDHDNVPKAVVVNKHVGMDGATFYTMAIDFGLREVTFHIDSLAQLAAFVKMIGDAFEKGTGDFLVPRVCAWCDKYLGVGTSAIQGATHGICPDCEKNAEEPSRLWKLSGTADPFQSDGRPPSVG